MTSKKEQTIYKSSEQLRSALFPKLVEREMIEKTKQDTKKFGNYLADKAIDKILKTA